MIKYIYLIPLVMGFFFFGSCKKNENSTSEQGSKTSKVSDNKKNDWTKNAVIYEVNVRQYSEEGTLNKVTEDLQRIKDLGVDVVWLMPIHPIGELNRKGTLGSYYAVKDYKAVNPEFGTLEDLKNLINKAHDMDMKVILDWVANHSSPDNVWIEEHLDYYTKDSLGNAPIPTVGTDWLDVADLNYDNPEMRVAMIDALKFWVTEADIDGFRCDVAGMVPLDFWVDATSELNKIKPLFWLAEDANPEIHKAFDMSYGWPLKDLLISIEKGEKDFSELKTYNDSIKIKFQPEDIIMGFTTNHDENSWHEPVFARFGENHLNHAVVAFTQGTMPLLYNGQESGMNKSLEFFEKDLVPWGDYKYADFYKSLIKMYKENPALWNGAAKGDFEIIEQDNEKVLVYRKFKGDNDLIFIQNYGDADAEISLDLVKDYDLSTDLLSGAEFEAPEDKIVLSKNSTLVFKKV